MKSTVVLVLVLGLSLVACGGKEPPAGDAGSGSGSGSSSNAGSPAERTQASLQDLIDLARAGKRAEAAALIVYRGSDRERRWKVVCDYGVEEEKKIVDGVCDRLVGFLEKGDPVFLEFESETESEGTWLVWHTRFGAGEDGSQVTLAALELADGIALGDVDVGR